ncbi:MAG TPA: polysaccharide biosynthesis tyrosine autokinase [Sphingomonas sp.]|nr:polysaccharide biosynthesis tyrosine autokinase [Sphingomonas sp.]
MPATIQRTPQVIEKDAGLLDLRVMVRALRRSLWPALIAFVVVLLAVAIVYKLLPRAYSATATIALDRRVANMVAPGADPQLSTDSASVDTAVRALTSPTLAQQVVSRLNLASHPGFGIPPGADPRTTQPSEERAVSQILGGLTVKRQGTSYAIDIHYTAADPRTAATIANTVVDEYVNSDRNRKVAENARQAHMLEARLGKLRGEVIQADAAVADYRAKTNLVDVTGNSTQQEIATLDTQLAQARADQATAQAQLQALGSLGAGAGDAALNSTTLRELRAQQAQLTAQRAEMEGMYGDGYPPLRDLKAKIADVDASIDQELARVRANAAVNARMASGRASSVNQSRGAAQGTLMADNKASVRLNDLQRTADSARSLYQSLLDRYRQVVASQGAEGSAAYILGYARVPSAPSSPSAIIFGVGGLVAALMAMGVVVFVLRSMERGFHGRADVEESLGVPVFALIPDLRTIPKARYRNTGPMGPAHFLLNHEGSVFNEAFRCIRGALNLQNPARATRSLAVTSALPNEGKTTVSICLSLSAARAGLRVLLIDCDVRRRASSRSMSPSVTAGLIEVLKNELPLERAIIRESNTNVSILPQRPADKGDYDLMTSGAMRDLIARAETMFDLVVLDTAPVLPLADSRAICAMAARPLLVVQWEKTPVEAAQLALELLYRAGANTPGAALSMVDLRRQARTSRDDEMVYYKRFQQYYSEA